MQTPVPSRKAPAPVVVCPRCGYHQPSGLHACRQCVVLATNAMAHLAAMPTDALCPAWPPPDDGPLGEARARTVVGWVARHAPPLVAEARRRLLEQFPESDVHTSSVTAEQLATWRFPAGMPGLLIGVVWCRCQGGDWADYAMHLRRDGRLELRPGRHVG